MIIGAIVFSITLCILAASARPNKDELLIKEAEQIEITETFESNSDMKAGRIVIIQSSEVRSEKTTETTTQAEETELETEEEMTTKTEETTRNVAETTEATSEVMEKPEATTKVKKGQSVQITYEEYNYLCRIVMGEAGSEPHDGQILVAQCLYNAMAESGKDAWAVKSGYGYCGSTSRAPTESVKKAVKAVFYDGYKYTEEKVLFFYAPQYCSGSWHETQKFVCEVGGHRFFARW